MSFEAYLAKHNQLTKFWNRICKLVPNPTIPGICHYEAGHFVDLPDNLEHFSLSWWTCRKHHLSIQVFQNGFDWFYMNESNSWGWEGNNPSLYIPDYVIERIRDFK